MRNNSAQKAADQYADKLAGCGVIIPELSATATSSWAQYVIRLPKGTDRQAVQDSMRKMTCRQPSIIRTYAQKPYAHYPISRGGRTSEALAADVWPYLYYLNYAHKAGEALKAAL